MKTIIKISLFAIVTLCSFNTLSAQDAVVANPNPEALFTSTNPKLHKNKQVVYHIVKDLLECNHWELADKYIAKDYIQHNPNAANGLDAVVKFFTEIIKVKPTPIPEKMKTKVVSVVAEGDLVTVAYVSTQKTKSDPSKTYTTTWFDQWRIVKGKATEHWDGALLMN